MPRNIKTEIRALVEIGTPQRPPPARQPAAAPARPRARQAAAPVQCRPVPGIDASEHEVLFGVLAPCLGWIEAAEAAEAALLRFGGLAGALAAPEGELAALDPLGEAGAATLKGLAAAARHLGALRPPERPVLRGLPAILAHLRATGPLPAGLRAIFLDARDRMISEEAMGRADAGAAGRVLRRAVALNAIAVIVLRHDPDGDPTALDGDVLLARRIATAGEVMEVDLRDHLVVGRNAPESLRGLGLMG
jgi:DNA repair protein RadC